jgi:hypothetical protein
MRKYDRKHLADIPVSRWLTFLGILFWSACVEKMPLPSEINQDVEFAAGDTTYLPIAPEWGEEYGFLTPVELSIAPDGRIFIADPTALSIHVLEQDGGVPDGFQALRWMQDDTGGVITPIDVDIDRKMNVYFIDGTARIFVWNQYWNMVGIDSVAVAGTFIHSTGDTSVLTTGSEAWVSAVNDRDWELVSVTWGAPSLVIDSLLAPHLFFDGTWPQNVFADIYYDSERDTFSAIAAPPDGSNFLYAADLHHRRIIRIDFERTWYLRLGSGAEVWTHRGLFAHSAAQEGTGAGKVQKPLGMDVDYAGNIYYSQIEGFFAVHKIHPTYSGGYLEYPSVFEQGVNDIMDLFRFSAPFDVAVDQNQYIYVANTGEQEIQVFDSEGQFFLKAGVEKVTVDTTLEVIVGNDTVRVDTFYTVERKGFLTFPTAVAVDDRGVIYVCDTPEARIVRYRLSNRLDEDLQPLQ